MNVEEDLYLTDSGTKLYKLRMNDPLKDAAFELVYKKEIVDDKTGKAIQMANELEYIDKDEIWANIYGKDCIARINPATGKVFGWLVGGADLKRNFAIGRQ